MRSNWKNKKRKQIGTEWERICSHHKGKSEFLDKAGYRFLFKPGYNFSTSTGWVAEHRMVMMNKLGRKLKRDEIIHHIDRDILNNSESNLMLLSRRVHDILYNINKAPVTIKKKLIEAVKQLEENLDDSLSEKRVKEYCDKHGVSRTQPIPDNKKKKRWDPTLGINQKLVPKN